MQQSLIVEDCYIMLHCEMWNDICVEKGVIFMFYSKITTQ